MSNNTYGDPAGYVTNLHVQEDCQDHPYTREIIERTGLPVTIVPLGEHPKIDGVYPANMTRGKHHLFLSRYRGTFFKPCPGTREYRCCGYYVLNIGMNCPMDCVYCILQAYLNNPWLSFFVNVEDLYNELDQVVHNAGHEKFRIGTGEFTDSLALESITGLGARLAAYMGDKPNGVLELKTKSDVINGLDKVAHNGRTIIAWSLNSTPIMAAEEIRTASLEQRLAAAAKVTEWGYNIAFHFDPIIYHENWKEGYTETINRLFEVVDPERIVWISMGALRFLPSLKKIATERFPRSRFFYQEFVMGLDNKFRYFRPHRVEMYTHIYNELRKHTAENTAIYFCMESDEIWQEVFGSVPEEFGGVAAMLDRAVELMP